MAGNIPARGERTLSPRPAVPPGTVHVSLTPERYIPTVVVSEFAGLFDLMSGQSLVQVRLIELSGDGGLFIFIYPTKRLAVPRS